MKTLLLIIALLFVILCPVFGQDAITGHDISSGNIAYELRFTDDSHLYKKWFVDEYDEYSKECFADSSLIGYMYSNFVCPETLTCGESWSHEEFLNSSNYNTITQSQPEIGDFCFHGQSYKYRRTCYCHRQPTFDGFIEFLRKKATK